MSDFTSPAGQRMQEISGLGDVFGARIRALRKLPQEDALTRQAFNATSASKRIHWLRRAADSLATSVAAATPCGNGCSSCCHQSVAVSMAEAILIASETGLRLDRHAGHVPQVDPATGKVAVPNAQAYREAYLGSPCTMLVDGRCAIYRSRPIACRLLLSVDRDDLLCRIRPGEHIVAPYVDVTRHHLAYVMANGTNARYADIRNWFPEAPRGLQPNDSPTPATCHA